MKTRILVLLYEEIISKFLEFIILKTFLDRQMASPAMQEIRETIIDIWRNEKYFSCFAYVQLLVTIWTKSN